MPPSPSCRALVNLGEHGALLVNKTDATATTTAPLTMIQLHAVDAPLIDVVLEVARVLGISASMDSAFAAVPISVHTERATADDVLQRLIAEQFQVSGSVGYAPRAMCNDGLRVDMAGTHYDMAPLTLRAIPTPSAQAARELQPFICETLLNEQGEVFVVDAMLMVHDHRSRLEQIDALLAMLPTTVTTAADARDSLDCQGARHERPTGVRATATTLSVTALKTPNGPDTPIRLEAHGVRAVDVVLAIGAAAGIDVSIDRRLADKRVAIRLEDVSARDALALVLADDHRLAAPDLRTSARMFCNDRGVTIEHKSRAEIDGSADDDDLDPTKPPKPKRDPHTPIWGTATLATPQAARALLPVVCRLESAATALPPSMAPRSSCTTCRAASTTSKPWPRTSRHEPAHRLV